jgi:serine protease Do
MSNRTIKIAVIVAVVAIIFSAFNTYLILDNLRVQNQLNSQEQQINELQTNLEQLSIQNQKLNELQTTLEEQEEKIDELQNNLEQINTSKAQISELQLALQQLNTQETQIDELQTALNEAKNDIQEAQSNLSNLSTQINSLNQNTTRSLAEMETTIETLEETISNLSNLEKIIEQINYLTPAEVYESTYRSVVVIRTPLGQGSGFLYNTSNIIITNYHVVEEETNIEIEFFDRTRTQATIIGSDPYADIAVLTVPTTPAEAKPLTFGNQTSIGQEVVAIGNPLGLTDSLSVGHISQVNRLLDLEPIIVPVLQLDLTIAPGSSGGPLLDMYGNVVGITNAGTEVGFNFAVPVNIMTRAVSSIIETGEYKHPFVGISILALTPEVISGLNIVNVDTYQNGLLIMDVMPNLPAEQAGLNPAIIGTQSITAVDIILAVDDNPTFTIEDWSAYMEVEISPDQTVTLTLWRSGETVLVEVTTTERPPYES